MVYLNVTHSREVPNDPNITHIRFGVKAKGNAFLLLSENPPNSIDTSTDHDFVDSSYIAMQFCITNSKIDRNWICYGQYTLILHITGRYQMILTLLTYDLE